MMIDSHILMVDMKPFHIPLVILCPRPRCDASVVCSNTALLLFTRCQHCDTNNSSGKPDFSAAYQFNIFNIWKREWPVLVSSTKTECVTF